MTATADPMKPVNLCREGQTWIQTHNFPEVDVVVIYSVRNDGYKSHFVEVIRTICPKILGE